MAELEAVVQGVTLAAKWGVSSFRLMADSKTVAGWLSQILQNTQRVRTTGLHELLVQCRLQILNDLVATLGLVVKVAVPSQKNRANKLIQVPKEWLVRAKITAKKPDVVVSSVSVLGPITREMYSSKGMPKCGPDYVRDWRGQRNQLWLVSEGASPTGGGEWPFVPQC